MYFFIWFDCLFCSEYRMNAQASYAIRGKLRHNPECSTAYRSIATYMWFCVCVGAWYLVSKRRRHRQQQSVTWCSPSKCRALCDHQPPYITRIIVLSTSSLRWLRTFRTIDYFKMSLMNCTSRDAYVERKKIVLN